MIVELFGPPCAGKTTFARILVTGLQARGVDAKSIVSARASELEAVMVNAVTKAAPNRVAETQAQRHAACVALNKALLRLLPPRNPLWHFRLRRYLNRLAASWTRHHATSDVVVFDQGYTQALCSLISLTRQPDAACVRAAVNLLPEPALRVHLAVPRDVLLSRLVERSRNLTLRERVMELDNTRILEQDRICVTLSDILSARGSVMRSMSSGSNDVSPLLDAVARKVRPRAPEPREPSHMVLREVGAMTTVPEIGNRARGSRRDVGTGGIRDRANGVITPDLP